LFALITFAFVLGFLRISWANLSVGRKSIALLTLFKLHLPPQKCASDRRICIQKKQWEHDLHTHKHPARTRLRII